MKKMNTLEKVQKSIRLVAVAALTLGMVSCSDDNNTPVNEEEVITTVTVRLTGGGQVVTLTSRDLDGDGPNAPVVTASGNLTPNTTYTGTVSFLNEAETPAEDKTAEIQAEGLEHQVFFQPTSGLGTFTYTDSDSSGRPIGLTFNYVSGNAGTGNLTVTLRHMPNKAAAGVAAGDITNAGGSTDVQVQYPITIN